MTSATQVTTRPAPIESLPIAPVDQVKLPPTQTQKVAESILARIKELTAHCKALESVSNLTQTPKVTTSPAAPTKTAVEEKKPLIFSEFREKIITELEEWYAAYCKCPKPSNFFKVFAGAVLKLVAAANISEKIEKFKREVKQTSSFKDLTLVLEGWRKSLAENKDKARTLLSKDQLEKIDEVLKKAEEYIRLIKNQH